MRRSSQSILLWACAGLLLAMILALAGFQARFIDRLHRAEAVRRKAELARSLQDFQTEFDLKLIIWQVKLRDSLRVLPHLEELQPLWQQTMPRGLVGNGYLCMPCAGPSWQWWLLPANGRPIRLTQPPAYLMEDVHYIVARGRTWFRLDSAAAFLPRTFDAKHLAVPLSQTLAAPELISLQESMPPPLEGFVELDRESFDGAVLRPLVRQYLPAWEETLDYALVESEGAQARILFRSSPRVTLENLGTWADSVRLLAPERIRFPGLELMESELTTRAKEPGLSVTYLSTSQAGPLQVGQGFTFRPRAGREWTFVVGQGALERALAGLRRKNLLLTGASLGILALSLLFLVFLATRAARLARAQTDFVSSVSHELRTPLTVIRTASANLADGLVVETAQVREYGLALEREARRLGELVHRVLLLSRTRQGLPRQPVAVASLVEQALAAFEGEIAARGIAVGIDLPPGLPAVSAHPEALQSALENLIGNALKYGGGGGILEIDGRIDPLRLGEVEIAVADCGPGIAPGDRRHLFEPFYRGASARAQQTPGTGLGLHVVDRIVRACGGRVTFDSDPGRRTIFRLHLPVARREESAA